MLKICMREATVGVIRTIRGSVLEVGGWGVKGLMDAIQQKELLAGRGRGGFFFSASSTQRVNGRMSPCSLICCR